MPPGFTKLKTRRCVSRLRKPARSGPRSVPRAVLDTNVLVSALISPGGPSAALLLELRAGAFELVASPTLLAELGDVLGRPKFRPYVTAAETAVIEVLAAERRANVKNLDGAAREIPRPRRRSAFDCGRPIGCVQPSAYETRRNCRDTRTSRPPNRASR